MTSPSTCSPRDWMQLTPLLAPFQQWVCDPDLATQGILSLSAFAKCPMRVGLESFARPVGEEWLGGCLVSALPLWFSSQAGSPQRETQGPTGLTAALTSREALSPATLSSSGARVSQKAGFSDRGDFAHEIYNTAAGARVGSTVKRDNSNGEQNLKWFGEELKYGEGAAGE